MEKKPIERNTLFTPDAGQWAMHLDMEIVPHLQLLQYPSEAVYLKWMWEYSDAYLGDRNPNDSRIILFNKYREKIEFIDKNESVFNEMKKILLEVVENANQELKKSRNT